MWNKNLSYHETLKTSKINWFLELSWPKSSLKFRQTTIFLLFDFPKVTNHVIHKLEMEKPILIYLFSFWHKKEIISSNPCTGRDQAHCGPHWGLLSRGCHLVFSILFSAIWRVFLVEYFDFGCASLAAKSTLSLLSGTALDRVYL